LGCYCYQLHTKFYQKSSPWSPYIDEVIGNYHYGFQCNRSTTDQIFCICKILEKKWNTQSSRQPMIQLGGHIVQYSYRVSGIEASHSD
jgi:hypothetical protein